MSALLPLLGGLLLARFVAQRRIVVLVELILFALAAGILVATAPDHGHDYAAGVLLSVVLAPLCVLAVVLGSVWRNRSAGALN